MGMAAGVGIRGRTDFVREVIDGVEDEEKADAVTTKRRKVEEDGSEPRISTSCGQQLDTCEIVVSNSSEPQWLGFAPPRKVAGDRCGSTCSDRGQGGASVSRCSSDGSSEKFEFVDPEEDGAQIGTSSNYSCDKSTTDCCQKSEEPDAVDSSEEISAESRRRPMLEKTPTIVTEAELEVYFSSTEKKVLSEFTKKYNFDFEKEEPLDGRFEWVRLKP